MTGGRPVGRDRELAQVRAALQDGRERFGGLVLEGEPGIGKTALWREGCRLAQADGRRLLSCRPGASEAKLSFAAIADMLAEVDPDELAGLPGPQRDALEIAMLRRAPPRGPLPARAVAAGFLGVARSLAAHSPIVLAIDDLQWLDRSSRRVIDFALARIESEPIVLLGTERTPRVPASLGVMMPDRVRRITVGPLGLDPIAEIIGRRLGRTQPRPLLARVVRAARGNPFHCVELSRELLERGVDPAPGEPLPVPADVRALTRARIARLQPDTREALLLAATLTDPDDTTIDAAALATAEEAGIVTVDGHGRIEFIHPLFAEAAIGSMATVRRRSLHRAAAELVGDPEQRARHLALSGAHPDGEIAAGLDAAAGLAAGRGAPDAAAELSELAADRTPPGGRRACAGRRLRAARFWLDAGDLHRAESIARDVIAALPPQAGPVTADPLRAEALQLLGQLRARLGSFAESDELAALALRDAGGDDGLRAGIELDLAFCAAGRGAFPDAIPHADAAIRHAIAGGSRHVLAAAQAVRVMGRFLNGHGLDAAELARAVALEEDGAACAFVMRPRFILGLLQLWTGDVEAAAVTLDALLDEVSELGQEGTTPMLFLYLVWAALWRGLPDEAAGYQARADAAAALLEDPMAAALAASATALVAAHRGDLSIGRDAAQRALAMFEEKQWPPGTIWPLWALGQLELSAGDPAAADRALRQPTEMLLAAHTGDPALLVFVPDEVEALIALGELDRAQAFLEPFAERARVLDRPWAIALASRCRGELLAACGEGERALGAFEAALDAHGAARDAHGAALLPLDRARTLLLAGQACRRLKRRGQARALLGEALDCCDRLGSTQWAARAAAELDRVGGATARPGELTATERRIAELVAAGLSNREVSERAFVSLKTVEANLTRVYRKLGVRSRTALARRLASAGSGRDSATPEELTGG